MKFIYWFAYYNTASPSVRYRGQYPLEYLKGKGIDSYFITPGYHPVNIFRFLRAYISALFFTKPHSIIVIQRVNSNFIYASLLKLLVKFRKQHTLYDLDDADYLVYHQQTINYFLKNCAGVAAGSKELYNYFSSFNNFVILNTSPVPDFKIVKQKRNDVFTIGWIGGFGGAHRLSLLKYFFPSLRNFPFKVRLVLLGVANKHDRDYLVNYFSLFENVILEIPSDIEWTNEISIQNRLVEFDIGIATLLDTEAQRAKSAFKLKQYMNNGVPVLSFNIPENNVFLKPGINGYYCKTPEEFRNRILEIYAMDETSYRILSENARKCISNFDHKHYVNVLMSFYAGNTNSSHQSEMVVYR